MSHRLDIQGDRFVAEVLADRASMAPDVVELGMSDSELVKAQNVVQGQRSWVKRSGMPFGAGGQVTNSGGGFSDLTFFPGVKRQADASSTVTNAVYYGYDAASSGSLYAQFDEATPGSAVTTGKSYATTVFYGSTFFDDSVLVDAGSNSHILAGTVHAEYTGTATFSSASATVSAISSALTAAQQKQMVGSWVMNTGDSTSTRAVYRVKSVDSSTQITLDRAFAGSNTGSAKAIRISAVDQPRCTSGTYITGSAGMYPFNSLSVWGRLLVDAPSVVSTAYNSFDTNRLRWTGLVGSSEGTSPFVGRHAFHANGYWDLADSGGYVTGLEKYNDAVFIFQQRRITVAFGAPVFDGLGSLDFSTTYEFRYRPGASGNFFTSSPYGVFFIDFVAGLSLMDGSGPPRRISDGRAQGVIIDDGLTRITFFRDHVILFKAASSTARILIYHVPSDTFSVLGPSPSIDLSRIHSGRGTIDSLDAGEEQLVSNDGTKVVDIGYAFSYPYASQVDDDHDNSTVDMVIETPAFGPMDVDIHPEKMWVTYKTSITTATDNPWLRVTLNTGPPTSSYPHANSWSSTATDLPHTGGKYVTREVDIDGIARGAMLKVKLESQGRATDFEISRVLVTGSAEGMVG